MSALFCWIGSWLWSLASLISRRWGPARKRLPVRVISVGNIQAGGAGKTPLVAWLARDAASRGLGVCILCRGYGGEWESRGGVMAPAESAPSASECGDEAALLKELASSAWIGVGADRIRSFKQVEERARAAGKSIDLVILDDGFQSRQIAKDVEIVALTSARRTERLFREFPSALRHADLVVWTKGESRPENFGRPMIRARFRLPSALTSAPLFLVTGLADGAEAVRTARAAGYLVDRHIPFPDHARYAEVMVKTLINQAQKNGQRIAVTGKDWVKWREFVQSADVLVLEPEVEVDEADRGVWNQRIWGEER